MERPSKRHSERYGHALEAHDEKRALSIAKNLGLSEKDLAGKLVLDIGSGGSEFARWGDRQGAKVIAIDHRLKEQTKQRLDFAQTSFVMGTAHALPFPDESFDLVVSHASMPNITTRRAQWESRAATLRQETQSRLDAVYEAIRVVKKDGVVRLAPIFGIGPGGDDTFQSESLREVIEKLRRDETLEVVEEPLPDHPPLPGEPAAVWSRLVIRHRVLP